LRQTKQNITQKEEGNWTPREIFTVIKLRRNLLKQSQHGTQYSTTYTKNILIFFPTCCGQSQPSSGQKSTYTHCGR